MSLDLNVNELRRSSSPTEYGTMLRLATEMELLEDSDLEKIEGSDLWTYLQTKGFEPTFIEKIAKTYWRRACHVVDQIPYRDVVTEPGCTPQRRLMIYFLREVCHKMTQEA